MYTFLRQITRLMSRLKILVDEQIGQVAFISHVMSAAVSCMWWHLAALLITIQEVPGPLETPIGTIPVS